MEFYAKALESFSRGFDIKLYALIAYLLASMITSAAITTLICIQTRTPCPVVAPKIVKLQCPKPIIPPQAKRIVRNQDLVPTTDGRQF